MMATGAMIIGLAIHWTGRAVQHTLYRVRRWTSGDTFAALGCALTLTVALTQREALYYSPYPQLSFPPFNSLVGLAFLGLLAPAIVKVAQEGGEQRGKEGQAEDSRNR
jgi:hypothetical protein